MRARNIPDRHLRDLINLEAARGSIRSVITARNESVTCRCFESLGAENQVSKGVPRPGRLLLSAISLTASVAIF